MDIEEQEQWKLIQGYNDKYSVSNKGNVKNNKTNKIMKGYIYNGYYKLDLQDNRTRKRVRVHRLVALAFIPNPDNKPYVDHIDNNKLNNNLNNLRWCTQSENQQNSKLSSRNTTGVKGVSFEKKKINIEHILQ